MSAKARPIGRAGGGERHARARAQTPTSDGRRAAAGARRAGALGRVRARLEADHAASILRRAWPPPSASPSRSQGRGVSTGSASREAARASITAIRSDEREELVEVLRDQQDAGAALARLEEPAVHLGRAPTSRPRVGWLARISRGSRVEHAGEDQLLDVAAGEQADRRVRARAADVVGARSPPRRAARDGARSAGSRRAGRSGAPSVSRARFSATDSDADDAVVVAILRDARDAGRDAARAGRRRRASRRTSAAIRAAARVVPGDERRERGLAVAGDAGDADDLALAHRRASASTRPTRPARRRDASTRSSTRSGAPGARGSRRLAGDLAPDHQGRRARARSAPATGRSADLAAAAQHGDAVGERQHLAAACAR